MMYHQNSNLELDKQAFVMPFMKGSFSIGHFSIKKSDHIFPQKNLIYLNILN